MPEMPPFTEHRSGLLIRMGRAGFIQLAVDLDIREASLEDCLFVAELIGTIGAYLATEADRREAQKEPAG